MRDGYYVLGATVRNETAGVWLGSKRWENRKILHEGALMRVTTHIPSGRKNIVPALLYKGAAVSNGASENQTKLFMALAPHLQFKGEAFESVEAILEVGGGRL